MSYPHVESIAQRLFTLAASDFESESKITSYKKRRIWVVYWINFQKVVVWSIILSIVWGLINVYIEEQEKESIVDGDIVFTDSTTVITPPIQDSVTLSPEEIFQILKQKELDNGFQETSLSNSELSQCYNFSPEHGSLENYLEIHVGGGTDVAIKLLDYSDNRCIRYVFVNSGSTYRIENIREGQYYLKIAYGREWLSKVEGGQCIGKFIRRPKYEKGVDVMDYTMSTDPFGTQTWTNYSVKLDVIDTDFKSSFTTEGISEGEFNQ